MSIAVLTQVYDEMRRLAIAGSAVAAGDFRLKKLIPPLEQAGAKAPVFAKVGQAVQAVVDSNDKTASIALLELATLVNAILYTQGETGIAGELKPLESTDLGGQSTQASARILKPLLEALSSTGSGRLELVRDAIDRGTFKDLRLVKPALNAIDDPYPEIADLIVEKVLPMYGKAILPELRAKFDVKGRGGHVHRLELMHRLDPQGSRDLIQLALAEGSKEVKVAAVECLGTSSEDLVYLLDQAKAKAKDVRAAALRALTASRAGTAEVLATLKKAILGDDLELIIARVKETALPEIKEFVMEQAEKTSAEVLSAKDKKLKGPSITRLTQLVSCMDATKDPKAEAFVLKSFQNAAAFAEIKSEPSGTDFNETIANLLALGTPKMQQGLVAAHKDLTDGMLSPALYAARAIMTPAAFYDEFSPLLAYVAEKRNKKNGTEHDRGMALVKVLSADNHRFVHRFWMGSGRSYQRSETPLKELDPRWLDAAVKAQSRELVLELARPNHPATNQFLQEQLVKLKDSHEAQEVLQVMVRIQHPGATDAIIEALKKQAKATSHYYFGYWYGRMVADLPRRALPQIEALLPTLPDKMVDQLMDSVLALKNKPE